MKHPHHHYRSHWRRGIYAITLVTVIVAIGTLGIHWLEGMSYLDAFYFISMIATSQGPIIMPTTAAGKLFTVFMAYISVSTVVAALGFFFGPFFGQLWHAGVKWLEDETGKSPRR